MSKMNEYAMRDEVASEKTQAALERDGQAEPTRRASLATMGVNAKQRIINLMAAHHAEKGAPPARLFLSAETENDLLRLPLEAIGNFAIELFMSVGVRGAVEEWGCLYGMAVTFDAPEDRVE